MNNNYLIPANSKKSQLYFGLFNKFDLILFGSGGGTSLLLMTIIPVGNYILSIIICLPAVITGFLVFPVPNYHNVLSLLRSIWQFYTTRQKFIWKGWCVKDEFKEDNKK